VVFALTYLRRYWLEKQKNTELFIFLMYDTMCYKEQARCKPKHSLLCEFD